LFLQTYNQDRAPGLYLRVLLLNAARDGRHFSLSLVDRNLWLQAANHFVIVSVAIVCNCGWNHERDPCLCVRPGKLQGTGHDSDDRVWRAVTRDQLADNIRIGAELVSPKAFA
jgi:hypothetical protein